MSWTDRIWREFYGFMGGKNHMSANAASIYIHKNYSGSGAEAFGGEKEWPVVELKAAFPTHTDPEKVKKLATDLQQVLVNNGFWSPHKYGEAYDQTD